MRGWGWCTDGFSAIMMVVDWGWGEGKIRKLLFVAIICAHYITPTFASTYFQSNTTTHFSISRSGVNNPLSPVYKVTQPLVAVATAVFWRVVNCQLSVLVMYLWFAIVLWDCRFIKLNQANCVSAATLFEDEVASQFHQKLYTRHKF